MRTPRELYTTLHDKLLTLPGDLEIYPGHFSGSLCGAGLSGKPTSTIAFERRWNPMLSMDREAFIDALANVPAEAGGDGTDSVVQSRTAQDDRSAQA